MYNKTIIDNDNIKNNYDNDYDNNNSNINTANNKQLLNSVFA